MPRSTKKNLSIPFKHFGGVPFKECKEILEPLGLNKYPYNACLWLLFHFLDWKCTERIGEIQDFMTGWTCYFSEATFAEYMGCCERTVRKALHKLVEVGILKSEKSRCYRYRIMLFEDALEQLRKDPPKYVRQLYMLSDEEVEELAETKHTTYQPNPEPHASNSEYYSGNSERGSDNQDSSRYLPEPPPPGPTPDPAQSPPEVEVGKTNVNLSNPEPHPRPTTKHRTEEKAEQKEETIAFFTSPSFELADKFAGDEQEFISDALREKRAYQFRDHLLKLFRSPRLASACPDPEERLSQCVQVLEIFIEIVKTRDNPAHSVGFINTEPGMQALAQARKQIFESYADWKEHKEIELDDNLVAMWEQQYGENWREKRRKIIAQGWE